MSEQVRILDTREYVSMLRDVVNEGREVTMVIAGNSMAPFLIHQRDRICFAKPDRPLKRGDIVFFERKNGQFVCHRIAKVINKYYYIVGDNQSEIEGPIEKEQIFARITKVERKGRWISSGDFWWDFFEKIWIRIIPFRGLLKRAWSLLRKLTRRKQVDQIRQGKNLDDSH